MENLKKYLVEFIGTFFLMFTVGAAILVAGPASIAPLAIGFILMIMVYAGGPISGGHFNPAVSLGAAVRGALEWKELIPYWVAQLLGAWLAAWLVLTLVNPALVIGAVNFDFFGMIVAEFLFSFALVFVVLMTATRKEVAGNSYFGFAIGGTVTVGAFVVGGISLAAFNPAVALGVAVLGIAPMALMWTTMAVNLLAGVCAALVFQMTNIENK